MSAGRLKPCIMKMIRTVTREDVRNADDSGGLKIFFGEEGHFVLFRAFKGPADSLDSALALVEHVTAAQSPTTD